MNGCNPSKPCKTCNLCVQQSPGGIPCDLPVKDGFKFDEKGYVKIKCHKKNYKKVLIPRVGDTTYLRDYVAWNSKAYLDRPSSMKRFSNAPWFEGFVPPTKTTMSCFFKPPKMPRKPVDRRVELQKKYLCQLKVIQKSNPMEGVSVARSSWGNAPTKLELLREVLPPIQRSKRLELDQRQFLSYPRNPPRPFDYSKLCEATTGKPLLVPRKLRHGICRNNSSVC